ncbi:MULTISPECIES: lysophospholipid acyltransferase family protein [unclassified Meridianimarinicoccus]|uniref:lysophospholipid acyltransferase family protein n=1 Tax=unclassified Meridianimarinicoccus TaxID=2923344 RepID=UPI00299F9025|nr:lysophospholipid acyltransferase family protein [Fluviibacterium sp. MJW13]
MTAPPWQDVPPPRGASWSLGGGLRVVLRGLALAVLVFGCLLLLLLVRLVERPLFGLDRPITPHITRFVCRNALRILGMGFQAEGTPMQARGAGVANHGSWLDIFALNARQCVYFVAKVEVSGWAGIGWLARATGTVFIARDRRQAAAQRQLFRDRLAAGHHLMFFPEGTSTDAQRVLPFKPTLFAAFFDANSAEAPLAIQPVSVIYTAPEGADPRFYGWWGEMAFAPHLLQVLAVRRHGAVRVIYHDPLPIADYPDRKALARAAEARVRAGVETAQTRR